MNRPRLLILNSLTFLGTIFINYWVNAGAYGKNVGDISHQYDTLITPADYAFGIWGFIYLFLFLFIGFQWYSWNKDKNTTLLNKIGGWFMVTNLANAAWVILWMQEWIGLSVMVMFVLLFSLIKLVLRLDLEIWDAPVKTIAFVWWPLSWYMGWTVLASVTNVAGYLTSIGWDGRPLTEEVWTVIMIFIAAVIYFLLIIQRNMREASLIGIWGFLAIAIKQWEDFPLVAYVALVGIVFLAFASGYHAYKNRHFSPVNKYKRGEI